MELKPIRTDGQPVQPGYDYQPAADVAALEQGQKVLRNTYMLLAVTMVPTIIGAFISMATASVILASPIISSLLMLGAVIGLQFAIAANRNSPIGIVLLLLMTGLLGWWLGPILNLALSMRNGMQLVGYAAVVDDRFGVDRIGRFAESEIDELVIGLGRDPDGGDADRLDLRLVPPAADPDHASRFRIDHPVLFQRLGQPGLV